MMRSVAPLIVSGALLSGCGVTAKIDARQEYQTSTAAYKNCLTINPPANCEGLRLAMEADAQRFNNLSAATGSSAGIMTIFNPQ